MNGPRVAWLLFLLTLVSSLWGQAADRNAANIVFLLTDDQRSDTLGSYGNALIHTPNTDALAQRGIVFENTFVTTSICAPNRASILSGQYVSRHGVWDFQTELSREQLEQTYPGLLKKAGYRLGFIGKWGVGEPPEDLFDYNRGFSGQGQYFLRVDGRERHLTSVMGDQALEFLDESNDQPFCLSISFKAPHVQDSYNMREDPFPFDPNLGDLYSGINIPVPAITGCEYFERWPAFLKNSENRLRWAIRFWGPQRYQESVKGYYRLISGVDAVVGRIVEKLQQKGFAENTVIIYSADNGFYLGEYGFAGKWYAHEISIRVPLIVYDPRLPDSVKGSRREELALSIDIAPTIAEIAGVEVPRQMQGRSLLSLMEGKSTRWRAEFFYEHLFEHPRIPKSEAVRTRRWKYIRYIERDPPYEELYDLKDDPRELTNLADDRRHRDRLETMRGKWRSWRERIRK